jgi:hypothetical protein
MRMRWIYYSLLCASAAGCNGSDDRPESPRYLPDWPEARAAVVTALTDWRDSSPPFPVSRPLKGVVFTDKQRKPGDRLRSFTILGQTDVENARQFTLRLDLESEEAPRLVRYNVLGRDPVWVFRLEDYEMILHWEHPMNEEPPAVEAKSSEEKRSEPPH